MVHTSYLPTIFTSYLHKLSSAAIFTIYLRHLHDVPQQFCTTCLHLPFTFLAPPPVSSWPLRRWCSSRPVPPGLRTPWASGQPWHVFVYMSLICISISMSYLHEFRQNDAKCTCKHVNACIGICVHGLTCMFCVYARLFIMYFICIFAYYMHAWHACMYLDKCIYVNHPTAYSICICGLLDDSFCFPPFIFLLKIQAIIM